MKSRRASDRTRMVAGFAILVCTGVLVALRRDIDKAFILALVGFGIGLLSPVHQLIDSRRQQRTEERRGPE